MFSPTTFGHCNRKERQHSPFCTAKRKASSSPNLCSSHLSLLPPQLRGFLSSSIATIPVLFAADKNFRLRKDCSQQELPHTINSANWQLQTKMTDTWGGRAGLLWHFISFVVIDWKKKSKCRFWKHDWECSASSSCAGSKLTTATPLRSNFWTKRK